MQRCSVVTTGMLQTDHVAALEGLQSEVTVSRRCDDLAELIAVVRTGRVDAVLVIGETGRLTESIVADLRREARAVVAISDLSAERSRLQQLGLVAFNDGVPAGQLAQALQAKTPPAQESSSQEEAEFAALVESSGMVEQPEVHLASGPTSTEAGSVITAVWGSSGAPGRTTVAVNLAAELAISGRKVLLIDADSYSASIAIHLGLLEESAGIAQVCRAAEFGNLDDEALLRATVEVNLIDTGCDVLTGIPRAERWTELRPGALERVLDFSRARYDQVIVDLGSEISPDHDTGFDAPAVQRNSAARTVLSTADRVIAVGAPDPVSFVRLSKAMQNCAQLLPDVPLPEVVINKLRRDAVGRLPRRQLLETWSQLDHRQPMTAFLPWDTVSCDAALRAGQVLAEAAADSSLRQQIAALAGIEVTRRRRGLSRKRRRLPGGGNER